MTSFRSSARRGIAAVGLACAVALTSAACGMLGGNSSASSSDACGDGSGSGNVTQCFGISDLGSKNGDAVVPAGTSVKFVCKDGSFVGIIVPGGMKNGDKDKVEWKTSSGALAVRGISTDYFRSVPSGLADCDKVLTKR